MNLELADDSEIKKQLYETFDIFNFKVKWKLLYFICKKVDDSDSEISVYPEGWRKDE